MRAPRLRLNATQAIAWLALFISLGGTVYAAAKINGKTIKVGSIPANRIKADSLTGAQVNEASLGNVPSASRAAEAEHAATATEAARATRAAEAGKALKADTAVRALGAATANVGERAGDADAAEDARLFGGASPSSYQLPCADGAIRGSVRIRESVPEGEDKFNCTGMDVAVTPLPQGRFRIEFEGLTGRGVAVATSGSVNGGAAIAPDETVPPGAPLTFVLTTFDTNPQETLPLEARVILF